MAPRALDDKIALVAPFISQCLRDNPSKRPFFVGLNGIQGAGKTTLVTGLLEHLRQAPHHLHPLAFSIDDLYLPHARLRELSVVNAANPLLQHRGQPGTHDVALGVKVFEALSKRDQNVQIPSYDKSAFSGQGDRAPESSWMTVNKESEAPIDVVLFEGWSVGFRPLDRDALLQKWTTAKQSLQDDDQGIIDGTKIEGRLGRQDLENVEAINGYLQGYEDLTSYFDAFVHIEDSDAEDTEFVYDWRLQQEAALRRNKGSGMTNDEVVRFVNGYYPSYELYLERLRSGVFDQQQGRQLRLVVGKDRRVQHHEVI